MAMTTTGDVIWDEVAYNKLLYFAFNEINVFDAVASVKPTAATHDGATTRFYKANNLTPTSTPLDQSTDVTPESMSDDSVLISAYEYGKAVRTTQLLRLVSIVPVIPAIARLLGVNAGQSMDIVAVNALARGTNVQYSGSALGAGARGTMTTASKLASNDVRLMKNRLRRSSVPRSNGLYDFFLHSDVLYDLLTETGTLGWTPLNQYTNTDSVRTFEIGVFNGFRFVETAHAPILTDAASSPYANLDLYQSFAVGFEAFAKTYSSTEGYGPDPITTMSPKTDLLNRFLGWGWKHFVGYGIFRNESLWRVESASSIGANT